MKKLAILLLAIITLPSYSYCIKNNTGSTFHVSISYCDWWFTHSYSIAPFEKICSMEQMDPNKTATYRIYNHVFSHYETYVENGEEKKHAVYKTFEQTIADKTTASVTIHGFKDNWIITR